MEPHTYGLTFIDNTHGDDKFLCKTERKGQAIIDMPYETTVNQVSERGCLSKTTYAQAEYVSKASKRFTLNELSLSFGEVSRCDVGARDEEDHG